MPQFKSGARESGEHLKAHRAIHAGQSSMAVIHRRVSSDEVSGLEKYGAFLLSSLETSSSYNPAVLREIMDGFRDTLFR